MANINFPNNPSVNDEFLVGGKTYVWDGVKWVASTTITKADVGLGNVQNFSLANQSEAEAGSVDNKYMTPLRTAQAIAMLAPTTDNLSDIGDVVLSNLSEGDIIIYNGTNWVNEKGTDIFAPNPFTIFTDTSGSPGSATPINDLDGNIMADLDKGIAYYGTVNHNDLFTADELSSAVGITGGTGSSDADIEEQSLWHKYYWNGGIHFWRKPIRHSVSWLDIAAEGAVYGTGTITSRKGESGTNVNQDKEVTKNGITYVVRLMEGSSVDPSDGGFSNPSQLHGSEFNLILMNLHAATNSGEYSDSPTNGVTYENWGPVNVDLTFTNNDFVGWKTNLGDNDFQVTGETSEFSGSNNGRIKWMQESFVNDNMDRLVRGYGNMSYSDIKRFFFAVEDFGWAPVLTVKHSSFTYE